MKFDRYKVEQCDLCERLSITDDRLFDRAYCERMEISFRCHSCMFPQYKYTLNTPMRGNVDKIYRRR